MFNGFPQSAADLRGLLLTYDEDTAGIPDQAIIEAAERFRRGLVTGQNKEFVPSIAVFCSEARRIAELLPYRNRPALPAPKVEPKSEWREPTAGEKARVQALLDRFYASNRKVSSAADEEAERAEIRAKYGMTPEAVASIKDQPLPSNFKQVGSR